MSSYLSRLSMRTQVASEPQQDMQPFVRSTSPVADQDQRIGMAGFENIEFAVALQSESNLDIGVEQAEFIGGSTQPKMTAVNNPNPGEAVVQRKMASSTVDSAASAAITAKSLESSDRPAREKTTVPSNTPTLPMPETLAPLDTAPKATEQNNLRQASTESSSLPKLAESEDSPSSSQMNQLPYSQNPQIFEHQTPESFDVPLITKSSIIADTVPPARVTAIAPETDDAGLEAIPSPATTADALASIPYPGAFSSEDIGQQLELKEVRSRTVRQAQGVDAPCLEPSTRPLKEPSESIFEVTPFSGLDETVSPQVVIGRINVEVVAPPAVEAPGKTSRSGPLTAESVSVIGPLGGRIRSNVRFSLRQR